MTSSFYCNNCNQTILGFIKDGCIVCKKKKLHKHLRYIFYSKCLIGIKIPIEIIIMITKEASLNENDVKIYSINNDCYRSSIHSRINQIIKLG